MVTAKVDHILVREAVLNILGPTGTIMELLSPMQPAGASFKSVGAIQATFVWSEPLTQFDTAPTQQGRTRRVPGTLSRR